MANLIFKAFNDTVRKTQSTPEMQAYYDAHHLGYTTYYMAPRVGKFFNPYNLVPPPQWPWDPAILSYTSSTISELMDQRAIEICRMVENDDKPIVIRWSGGIDSTGIIVAIMKNCPELKDRLVIEMTNASYFENPIFFHKVIKKLNYSDKREFDWATAWMISGEPGDMIWIAAEFINIDMHTPVVGKNVRRNPDALIDHFCLKIPRSSAEWYYEALIANADDAGYDLQTYEDFFWWRKMNFEMQLSSFSVIDYIRHPWNENSWENYLKHNIPWFITFEFQQWSYSNSNSDIKYGGNLFEYKVPLKQYIYDFDGNDYYRRYKVKVNSGIVVIEQTISEVYDDGTVVFR